jgi:DNA-binding MurR/RpiR family transcriptional regulator
VPSLEPVYRTGATVSRLNQLAVVDMIYALILSKDPGRAAGALEQTMAATHGLIAGPVPAGYDKT